MIIRLLPLTFAYLAQVSLQTTSAIYSNTADDCMRYVGLTKCTHCGKGNALNGEETFPYAPVDAVTPSDYYYETVTCDVGGMCVDGTDRDVCSWRRYHFETCVEFNNNIILVTATNSLPNHCYVGREDYAPIGTVDSQVNSYYMHRRFSLPVDKTMGYDTRVTRGTTAPSDYLQSTASTQTAVDNYLCNNAWGSVDAYITLKESVVNGPAAFKTTFTDFWTADDVATANFPNLAKLTSSHIVGIALNGVFLYGGATELKYDAFFPKAWGTNQSPDEPESKYAFDVCLGTYQTERTYRYHMFSPCILSTTLKTVVASCDSVNYEECTSDPRKYSVSLMQANEKTMIPIGVAKDGRVIYGPYKANGQLWQPCDVDICNGVRDGNTYYYVSSMFFPYFVGCWGPGSNSETFRPSCSTNSVYECKVQSNAMTIFNSIGLAFILALTTLLAL